MATQQLPYRIGSDEMLELLSTHPEADRFTHIEISACNSERDQRIVDALDDVINDIVRDCSSLPESVKVIRAFMWAERVTLARAAIRLTSGRVITLRKENVFAGYLEVVNEFLDHFANTLGLPCPECDGIGKQLR